VQIGTTNSASDDSEQNMPSFKLGPGSVLDLKELRSCRARRRKNGSFQFPNPFDFGVAAASAFLELQEPMQKAIVSDRKLTRCAIGDSN
jgi:hypothetical protein